MISGITPAALSPTWIDLINMEMLWDELCHHGSEPESPQWHKEILEKRQAGIAEGNTEYLTIEDLKKRFRA